mmetsp:Transcript_22683/g.37530  ORF Transcript_22683/g.37530 Transcript_22683/m.37530 type:complete len:219 (+) Transcript_22683:521-1177(+)
MDESTGLSTSSVHSEGDAHGTLHEETVQDSTIVTIVVETVDETFVSGSLWSVGSPDNTLMQVGNAEVVVLLVELPENGIQTLGSMVDRTRMGRVKNVCLTTSRKSNVNVSLRDLSSRSTVSVDTHGTKMNNVNIHISVNDSAAKVVGTTNVVVDCVTLRLGGLHRVWGSALLGKVDNRVGFLVLDQLHQQVIILGDIEVNEFHILSGDFLPCLATNLR